ncbi:hypothetical protein ANRL3_01606 [Anaerolineae bacterium]|nr:hypothetical protein ANRL3_01606 [Anaerolineae bacterium]
MRLYSTLKTQVVILMLLAVFLTQTACERWQTNTQAYNGYLVLEFQANRSQVRVGDTVQMRFKVTNKDQRPIVLEAKNRPVLDIVVSALPAGNVIRSWSNENPDKVSHRMEWKPGESQVLEMTWTVSPGDKLGIRISLSGDVNSDLIILKSSGVMLCLEGFCP